MAVKLGNGGDAAGKTGGPAGPGAPRREAKDTRLANPLDKRVLRTEQKIRGVFVDMLADREYGEITVGMILQRAGINRSTFYKHYINKNDLASEVLANCQERVISSLVGDRKLTIGNLSFFRELRRVMSENAPMLKILRKLDSKDLDLKESFHDYFYRYIKERHARILTGLSSREVDLGAYITAGILVSVIGYYIERDEEPQPETLTRIFLNI